MGRKIVSLVEFLDEVKVSNNNAVKYFKLIQKGIKSKRFKIEDLDATTKTVTFPGSTVGDLTLAIKDNRITSYSLDGATFREIPKSFTSIKDIIDDIKMLKGSKGKVVDPKKPSSITGVSLDKEENSSDGMVFDFENEKYGAVREGKLYRIYAKNDFGNVKKGDKGGLIEQESNLSEKGNCWVFDNAKVYGSAKVYDSCYITGRAEVYGNAEIYENAKVGGKAEVFGSARVGGNAEVYANAKVYDYAEVYENAKVGGDAKVYKYGEVYGNAEVSGSAKVDYEVDSGKVTS